MTEEKKEQNKQIYDLYMTTDKSQREIAEEYGLNQSRISMIVKTVGEKIWTGAIKA